MRQILVIVAVRLVGVAFLVFLGKIGKNMSPAISEPKVGMPFPYPKRVTEPEPASLSSDSSDDYAPDAYDDGGPNCPSSVPWD